MFILILPIYLSVHIRAKATYVEWQTIRPSIQFTHLEPHTTAQDKNRRARNSAEAGSRRVLNEPGIRQEPSETSTVEI